MRGRLKLGKDDLQENREKAENLRMRIWRDRLLEE